MAEVKFEKGDTVRVKSSGPDMTVSKTGKDFYEQEMVWCVWFEKTKKMEDTFPPEVLEKVTPAKAHIVGVSSSRRG
jgi:uncharacterized protein YodC (DUF2158 family)